MKIILVIIASLIAVIQAENCIESADCLTCGDGTTMGCVLPSDSTDRVCTCVGTSFRPYTTHADFRRNVCPSIRYPDEHCIDGYCRCLLWA